MYINDPMKTQVASLSNHYLNYCWIISTALRNKSFEICGIIVFPWNTIQILVTKVLVPWMLASSSPEFVWQFRKPQQLNTFQNSFLWAPNSFHMFKNNNQCSFTSVNSRKVYANVQWWNNFFFQLEVEK